MKQVHILPNKAGFLHLIPALFRMQKKERLGYCHTEKRKPEAS